MTQRLFRLLFWAALVFAFVMASLPQPPVAGDVNDKFLHVMAFATLAGLVALAYPRAQLWLLFAGLAAFGALIEGVQAIPSLGRDASWLDWFADIAAAGTVLALSGIARRWRSNPTA